MSGLTENAASSAVPRRELLALALLSAALLGYEVLLSRVIAIQHWHHLTEVVIAVALLGMASAAVLVAGWSAVAQVERYWLLPVAALATAATMPLSVVLAQQLPLNMLALPWYGEQVFYLLLYGLCFVLPFFCGGLFITLVFTRRSRHIGSCYCADLVGAASGVILVMVWLDARGLQTSLESAVLLCSALAAMAFISVAPGNGRVFACTAALAVALLLLVWGSRLAITPSGFKALSVQLHERGAELLDQQDSSQSRLTRVSSAGQHLAPGMSLGSTLPAPRQHQLFSDGDGATPLLLEGRLPRQRELFSQSIGGAAYILAPPRPRVLILPGNHSWNSWSAFWHDAAAITLVEPDRALAALLDSGASSTAGFLPDTASVHRIQPRRFLETNAGVYDLIIAEVDSQVVGSPATRVQLLLTRQALAATLDRLGTRGVLALGGQMMPWPRDSLRVLHSVATVLRERYPAPELHLIMIRDWRNYLLLVSRSPLESEQLSALRHWSQQWQFDVVIMPGDEPEEDEMFHQSPDAHLVESVWQLLSDNPGRFVAGYPFDLSVTDDNRPFFYHFFRWQHWRQVRQALGQPWLLYVGWGYLLNLTALIALTLAAAAVLLLAPLTASGLWAQVAGVRFALSSYFGAIGLGFMFIEIALLQKAVLLLDSPTEAFALVLVALLLGAGLGSFVGGNRVLAARGFWLVTTGIAAMALSYPLLLDYLFTLSLRWTDTARLAILAALLSVAALPMGVMLPQGIAAIRHRGSGAVAWGWAVNGFFSVCGALAAPLLAIELGWQGLFICAAALYLLAGMSHGGLVRSAQGTTPAPRSAGNGC